MSDLEDRLAIEDLLIRYVTALDRGDVEVVCECFTNDAVLESPVIGRIAGHAAIRDFADRFAAQLAAGVQFRHFVTNIVVDLAPGAERAQVSAYLLVLITKDGQSRRLPPGRYQCEAVKDGGNWRFSHRTVFHDHDYTLDGI